MPASIRPSEASPKRTGPAPRLRSADGRGNSAQFLAPCAQVAELSSLMLGQQLSNLEHDRVSRVLAGDLRSVETLPEDDERLAKRDAHPCSPWPPRTLGQALAGSCQPDRHHWTSRPLRYEARPRLRPGEHPGFDPGALRIDDQRLP